MSTACAGTPPLDGSSIDEHDNPISTRKRIKRVSLSPSSTPTPPAKLVSRHFGAVSSSSSVRVPYNGDDVTDDEVEFLYTAPAPSVRHPQMTPSRDGKRKSTLLDPKADLAQMQPREDSKLAATSDTSTAATNASGTRTFSYRSSAYLQSLAEICHAILWDARWRVTVGQSSQRLFAWEFGDDMSAIHTLARRYLPPTELLREDDHVGESVRDDGAKDGKILADHHAALGADELNLNDLGTSKEGTESEADLDRCLETYSRLYFRKGPWFRLDNVFSSYYLPKHNPSTHQSYFCTQVDIQASSSTSVPHRATVESTPAKGQPSPSKFFAPVSQRRENRANKSSNNKRTAHVYIDQDCINLLLAAAEVLMVDIRRLHRMGLVRTFDSEEECGKEVGKSERYTSGILRQDERRAVLANLGGQQKRKRPPQSNIGAISATSTTTATSTTATTEISENLIWKQMCQQQAIFKSFSKPDNDKKVGNSYLLPVVKHVNRILIEKWAMGIVLKASKVEYIPSFVVSSATRSISEALRQLAATYHLDEALCFRLREAPLQTLQRSCRLYLCATSGPGDMRGDGINGWRTLPDCHKKEMQFASVRTNVAPQPGSHSWNGMAYPGRDWRLRLRSCNFVKSYIPAHVTEMNISMKTQNVNFDVLRDDIHVFTSLRSFESWEMGVELRANVDYLLELNEILLQNERKQVREKEVDLDDKHTESDDEGEISSRNDPIGTPATKVDFLELLTIAGRSRLVSGFLNVRKRGCMQVSDEIERDVSELLGTPIGDMPLSALVGVKGTVAPLSPSQPIEKTRLQNECERILAVVAVTLTHVLGYRSETGSSSDVSPIAGRPWLRHMSWEGCMAYVLWDVIPILERRGYYLSAIKALEVLLFGKQLPRASNSRIPNSLVEGTSTAILAQSFLSRRVRGKAYERLIIDYTHVERKNRNETEASRDEEVTLKGTRGKSVRKSPRKPTHPTPNELVAHLIKPLLRAHAPTGQITFSATRTLARRLKCPLSSTLEDLNIFETRQLGHRFCNVTTQPEQEASKYSDWTPVIDTAVANAMISNSNGAGGRCAYIGFEDDEVKNLYAGSLNVEELAMEYYNKGVLPARDQSTAKGGWVGYHDEGGKIRTLFRIMCSAPLGMDWDGLDKDSRPDDFTLFLTPYQGAPFDLHVGAELVCSALSDASVPQRGIYHRKRSAIDEFLETLCRLQGAELANLVYDGINKRLRNSTSTQRIDPTLEKDVSEVRTLSMLAAGLGGNLLAAIFRSLFFDYRFYSGGLPDLLLFRAIYTATEELVILGDWVGESFTKEYQDAIKAQKIAQVFGDKDEEFLGCSKVGDSGGRSTNKWNKPAGRGTLGSNLAASNAEGRRQEKKNLVMPERLILSHDGRAVRVECMCVEVKSQNDRLDPRQEDWLNILDRFGNARVCKFVKQKLPKSNMNNNKENGSSSGNS